MSDSDSDESLNTEDLNEINSTNNNFEEEETVEVEVKSIEREKQTKKVKKSEIKEKPVKAKKERTPAQKAATARMLEANKKKKEEKLKNKNNEIKPEIKKTKKIKSKKEIENVISENLETIDEEVNNEINEEVQNNKKTKVKKPPSEKQLAARANLIKINKARAEARKEGKEAGGKLGRKKHEYNVIREKIIYMIPDGNGDFKKIRTPVITDKQRQKQEQVQKNKEEFNEIQEKATKILKQKKNGKIDGRSQKSEAQLKILEKAREKAKLKRQEQLKAKKEKEKNELKETITDSVIDVVTKPASEIKEIKQKKRLSQDQLKAYQLKKDLAMF